MMELWLLFWSGHAIRFNICMFISYMLLSINHDVKYLCSIVPKITGMEVLQKK